MLDHVLGYKMDMPLLVLGMVPARRNGLCGFVVYTKKSQY